MFKYNNTHTFTGYLKQFLSSFNLPACKIYTQEFVKHVERTGKEDPRVLESFDALSDEKLAVRINYLRNNEIYNYFWKKADIGRNTASWQQNSDKHYSSEKFIPSLVRNLNSPGVNYDTKTHEYLGDYLRFLRDYHNINLMSLYNCFTDKIYNNVNFSFVINPESTKQIKAVFNSQDPGYRIYAIPVKLFAEYTIAIDSSHGIELFCGLYNTNLDMSDKAEVLAARTYQKINKATFRQPFLYEKLKIEHWPAEKDFKDGTVRTDVYTRWDITNRERDFRLFIKVPTSCRSTITILEGDFRAFNNIKYAPLKGNLTYQRNHSVMNFNTGSDKVDLNSYNFKPISQLQLLAFNTGESYPFADRLVEYLSGSVITPIDEISDNIKRVQQVMNQNKYYFKIDGLWEDKMQNILYDYMINAGPIEVNKETGKLVDRRRGYHNRLGYTTKSTQFDILGYVDKDTEKIYSSWKNDQGQSKVKDSLQSVDIYDKLYDIK